MSGRSQLDSLSSEEATHLAARIRKVVEAIGNQSDAAQVAGVSLSQIKNYITGKSAPCLVPIARLARASNYSLDWIALGTEPRRTVTIELCTDDDAPNCFKRREEP